MINCGALHLARSASHTRPYYISHHLYFISILLREEEMPRTNIDLRSNAQVTRNQTSGSAYSCRKLYLQSIAPTFILSSES